MSILGEWIHFGTPVKNNPAKNNRDRPYAGYLARPERAGGALPAVLVFQEIWGVDAHIEDVTRRFAAAGYVAFAPDLYVEQGERPPVIAADRVAEVQEFVGEYGFPVLMNPAAFAEALGKKSESLRNRIQETVKTLFAGLSSGGLRLEKYLPICIEASRFLRNECTFSKGQKIAAVGYCMGGGLSALLACSDPELAGAVIYYGSAPDEEKLASIQCPILGLYGELDERVNAGISKFSDSMKKLGKKFDHVIYPGAQHAFFNDSRPAYNAKASRDSFVRTLEFLKGNLEAL